MPTKGLSSRRFIAWVIKEWGAWGRSIEVRNRLSALGDHSALMAADRASSAWRISSLAISRDKSAALPSSGSTSACDSHSRTSGSATGPILDDDALPPSVCSRAASCRAGTSEPPTVAYGEMIAPVASASRRRVSMPWMRSFSGNEITSFRGCGGTFARSRATCVRNLPVSPVTTRFQPETATQALRRNLCQCIVTSTSPKEPKC